MNKLLENAQEVQDTNKRLTEQTFALLPAGFPADFIMELQCECANKACSERISITYDEYEECLAETGSFVVMPEHYLPEFERVVRETLDYWVVVKRLEKAAKPFEV